LRKDTQAGFSEVLKHCQDPLGAIGWYRVEFCEKPRKTSFHMLAEVVEELVHRAEGLLQTEAALFLLYWSDEMLRIVGSQY